MHEAYGRPDPTAERASGPAGGESGAVDAPQLLIDPAASLGRSDQADTCPFLRADRAGILGPPIEVPAAANRCIAVGPPTPQSARQQQLVCLTAGHASCPRYLRGALVPAEPIASTPVERGLSPVIAASLVLIVAAAASVGFLLVRGGLSIPVAAAPPSPTPVVSPPPTSGGVAIASARPTATTLPTPSPVATAEPPTPEPTPSSTPPETPAATPTPAPTSSRYALLKPCPGVKDCWIYTVRSGDNLQSIVNWFGVPFETVLDMNPQIADPTTIRAGDKIKMPPPTR